MISDAPALNTVVVDNIPEAKLRHKKKRISVEYIRTAARLTGGSWRSARCLGPLPDPFEERVVPKHAVLRLENPVTLIGKLEQFGRDFLKLQRGEELQALRVGHTEIQLP